MPPRGAKAEPSLPQAHAGTLRQFVRYAQATGLDLDACLDAELRRWIAEIDTLATVPAHIVVDILEVCAALGQRPDLGIAFAAWSNPRGFGPLSLLWDHCPTFRDVVRIARRYLNLENEALGTAVEQHGEEVMLRHYTAVPARFGSRQFIEATLALDVSLGRLLLGPGWAPLRLELAHPAPRNTRYRRGFFACPIVHDAPQSALVVARADMDRVQPNANAPMLAYLEAHLLTSVPSRPLALPEQVEQAVSAALPGGTIDLDRVAAVMALSRRTLQRRLEADGLRFGDILLRVRRRVAEEYFANEARPNLAELAHRLGFRDAAVAGRFLKAHLAPARALKQQRRTPRA